MQPVMKGEQQELLAAVSERARRANSCVKRLDFVQSRQWSPGVITRLFGNTVAHSVGISCIPEVWTRVGKKRF